MKKIALISLISSAVVFGMCLPGQECEEGFSSSSSASAITLPSSSNCEIVDADYFFSLQDEGECLPGQECGSAPEVCFTLSAVEEIVTTIQEQEKSRFGTAQDYFNPESGKEYFDRETVDQILNQCRQDPQSCGINALPITKYETPKEEVVKALANRTIPVSGYYLNYGTGQFDWVYVSPRKNVYKLEKGIGPNYALQWNVIQSSTNKAFSDITIGNGYVRFGNGLLP
ncbi:MAG: hypothetical protein GXO61_02920 [Epsilonproteobacteria bacterium]|nr:hypothetical protein [Campylobacterota bacterium]